MQVEVEKVIPQNCVFQSGSYCSRTQLHLTCLPCLSNPLLNDAVSTAPHTNRFHAHTEQIVVKESPIIVEKLVVKEVQPPMLLSSLLAQAHWHPPTAFFFLIHSLFSIGHGPCREAR